MEDLLLAAAFTETFVDNFTKFRLGPPLTKEETKRARVKPSTIIPTKSMREKAWPNIEDDQFPRDHDGDPTFQPDNWYTYYPRTAGTAQNLGYPPNRLTLTATRFLTIRTLTIMQLLPHIAQIIDALPRNMQSWGIHPSLTHNILLATCGRITNNFSIVLGVVWYPTAESSKGAEAGPLPP